ncbi:unnamed protein product [Prorocentrum cordatum]|uniref:Uncharacterized protein n=1 Tax=Prorocentrum cordatum TaxID=2364126 RepID=A0ABN9SUI4_9DINO|nr:unnamed protein product [Polarella glacialis]
MPGVQGRFSKASVDRDPSANVTFGCRARRRGDWLKAVLPEPAAAAGFPADSHVVHEKHLGPNPKMFGLGGCLLCGRLALLIFACPVAEGYDSVCLLVAFFLLLLLGCVCSSRFSSFSSPSSFSSSLPPSPGGTACPEPASPNSVEPSLPEDLQLQGQRACLLGGGLSFRLYPISITPRD